MALVENDRLAALYAAVEWEITNAALGKPIDTGRLFDVFHEMRGAVLEAVQDYEDSATHWESQAREWESANEALTEDLEKARKQLGEAEAKLQKIEDIIRG